MQSERKPKDAPPVTADQLASIHSLADPQSECAGAILGALRAHVSEIQGAGWDEALSVLELADLIVFKTSVDGFAYMAFVFVSMEYEHGIGVVTHKGRIVHFGFAEEVCEDIVETDLRKQKRKQG